MEVCGLPALVVLKLEKARKLGPEEDDKVQKRHNGHDGIVPSAGGNIAGDVEEEVEHVDIREPLHADGEKEKQQHLRVGIEERERHEHGEVDIICTVNGDVVARDEADDARAEDGEQHAAQVIRCKLGCAPLPLERRADPVIEIAAHQQPEGPRVRRQKAEGQQPPELPLLEPRPAEAENGVKGASVKRGEQGEQIEGDVADDDVEHQVRNAEVRMQHAEAVDAAAQRIQGRSLRS